MALIQTLDRFAAANTPEQPAFRRITVPIALLFILGGAVALRCYHLADRSLWFDEAFCWRLMQFPFGEMIRRVGLDNHPPLYFILLYGWSGLFGDSVWALRSLSVLLGCLTILGVYLFVVEAFGRDDSSGAATGSNRLSARSTALMAACFVAVSV